MPRKKVAPPSPAPPSPPSDLFQEDQALFASVLADHIVTARGDGVEAVVAFGALVFGKVASRQHREWIANDLTYKRVCTTAPPGSAKTTWQIILMTWWIAKHPLTSNAIASAGEDAADDMTKAIADTIETNPRFKLVFPNIIPDKSKGWSSVGYNVRDVSMSEDEWSRKRSGDKNDTLIGGGVGSSRFNGFRVTGRFHLDDIHDRKSKHSEEICKATVDFVKDTALPRMTKTGYMSIRQTRWNAKDVVAWAKDLTRADGTHIFKVFFSPAILEDGQSYWPDEHSLAALNDKKAEIGDVEFELVYQGNDQALEGYLLKAEKLIYLPHLFLQREWPRYMGIDWAIKTSAVLGTKKRDSDDFCIAWVVDTGIGLCVEDGIARRMSQDEAENEFITCWQMVKPRSIMFETSGGGEVFYQTVWRRLSAQGISGVAMVGYKPTQNLIERVTTMEPDFARGYIKVSDADTPFLSKFKSQWLTFGKRSAHDDTLSGVYSAVLAAQHALPSRPRHLVNVTRPPNPFASLGQPYAYR